MSFLKTKQARIKKRLANELTPLAVAIKNKGPGHVEILPESDEELIQSQFKSFVLTLREIDEIENKIKMKREVLLPLYLPMAFQGMNEDDSSLDEIVVCCAMWCLDVGNIAEGVELALYACEQNLETPQHFKSDAQTFFTTEFLKWATPKIKKGESVAPFFTQWLDASEKWGEINKIEEANLYKWAGEIEHRAEKFEEALAYYDKATKLNDRVGCKERIKAAEAKKQPA